MKPNILENLDRNEQVADVDKQRLRAFFRVAQSVQFGRIAPRQDGYIFGEHKLPRCTSILQYDGSKAGALMEWAKRQVSGRIEQTLLEKLQSGVLLTREEVARICEDGLADPDRQRDEAAEAGTGAHDLIENWLTGYDTRPFSELPDPVQRFATAWIKSGYTCVGTEIPLVWYDANGQGFGGRLDILAYKSGKFYIGDNKTSRSVHNSYGLQIGSYKAAVEQMSDGTIKIAGGTIFHIPTLETLNERQKKEYDKRGSLIELKDLEDAFEQYRLLLGLYYKRNNKYF